MRFGVIGGADGPTAIFVATSVDWVVVGGVAIVALCVALFFVLRKRKKN